MKNEWSDIHEAMEMSPMKEVLETLYGNEWRQQEHHIEVIQIAQNTELHGGLLEEWPADLNHVMHHGLWLKVAFH